MTTYSSHLVTLYDRELDKLSTEIKAFHTDAMLWHTAPGISNSAGTLALHLVGNLNHFIGATIGGTGYVRDREAEFATRDISRAHIITMIAETRPMVANTLNALTDEALMDTFPLELQGKRDTTGYFLIFFYGHLQYHLGQINYLRRMIDIAA